MAARPRQAKRRNWPANLNQNGAGYFYWRDPRTKKDHGLGRDQAKAFQEARAANAEIARQTPYTSLVERISKPAGKTLREWAPEYESIYQVDRKPTESTMKTVKGGVRAVLLSPFADKVMSSITTGDVAAHLKEVTNGTDQKRGSANMAKLIRKTLMDMFREAEAAGHIEVGKNPVMVTRAPKITVERSRLTLEQFRAVYAEAQKVEPCIARSLELALLTGQRREDLAHMKFADVKDGFLHVIQSKSRGSVKLRIPLSLRLDAIGKSLEEVIKQCRDTVISKSILHHSRPYGPRKAGAPVSVSTLTVAFQELRDAAELTWEEGKTPATFHELRSLSARLYTELHGKEFAQQILGHSTAAMTDMYRDVRGAEWIEIKVAV
ncbi:tyrosine-type recombinase/integrase [Cupriavidus campinensis]|uniref:tyrosine-type recombinase/integrase n=1 Tax=Cupriavidus campinensis TaxID=151783 RepID=UPI0024E1D2CD|nr:tyrosine-type recombinase/integrase [Cupriavidus campinensis]